MILNKTIYTNPVIPPQIYCVKLLNLKQEPSTFTFPKLLLYFQIHEDHDLDNIILTSIIHPTPDAEPVYNMFVHTFLKSPDEELDNAKGRYGAVQVYNKKYEGTTYSMVKYIEQTNTLKSQMSNVLGEIW